MQYLFVNWLTGDCDKDADCYGGLICMQSETMKCPTYHTGSDPELDCCILPWFGDIQGETNIRTCNEYDHRINF